MAQTPAPWKDGPVFNKEGRAIFWHDDTKAGKWQRRVDRDKDGLFSKDDAELIVRAVNSHAALVGALENIQLEARSRVPSTAVIAKLAMDALSLAKQAP